MKIMTSLVAGIFAGLALSSAFAADQSPLVMQKMDRMPLAFTKNMGQLPDSILFRASAGGATMWFTNGGVYYQFTRRIPKPDETHVGADPGVSPDDPGSGVGADGGSPVLNDRFDRDKDSIETMMIKASFVGANPNAEIVAEGVMEYKSN